MSATKTKASPLTKTQSALLAVLRVYRASADASEAEYNARAIGGMTETEKFERGAISCRSQRHVQARDLDGRWFHAYNVKSETFHALEELGLAERRGFLVRATTRSEVEHLPEFKSFYQGALDGGHTEAEAREHAEIATRELYNV